MTSILVVDDDLVLRGMVTEELSRSGYDVAEADSAESARVHLRRREFDVLLTDFRMEGEDGLDLLESAGQYRALRTILMSGFATAKDHQTAMKLGAVDVLCKPFTPPQLLRAVEHAIDCETGFRGQIHGISLLDILQMFHFARRSVAVHIRGAVPATIEMQYGDIVHASHGSKVGRQALARILAAPSGAIITAAPNEQVETTIDVPFQQLVLDIVRVLDEEGNSQEDEEEPSAFEPDLLPSVAPAANSLPTLVPTTLKAPQTSTLKAPQTSKRAEQRWPLLATAVSK